MIKDDSEENASQETREPQENSLKNGFSSPGGQENAPKTGLRPQGARPQQTMPSPFCRERQRKVATRNDEAHLSKRRASSRLKTFTGGEAVRQPQLKPSPFLVGPTSEPSVSALPTPFRLSSSLFTAQQNCRGRPGQVNCRIQHKWSANPSVGEKPQSSSHVIASAQPLKWCVFGFSWC